MDPYKILGIKIDASIEEIKTEGVAKRAKIILDAYEEGEIISEYLTIGTGLNAPRFFHNHK